jgi:hypothetical protein
VDRETALALTPDAIALLSADDWHAATAAVVSIVEDGTDDAVRLDVLAALDDRANALGIEAPGAVTAGATAARRPRRTPVGAVARNVPSHFAPHVAESARPTQITRVDGSRLPDDRLADELIEALSMASRGYSATRRHGVDAVDVDGDVVACVRPTDALPLVDRRDAAVSDAALAAATAEALTAAGGICAPLRFRYELPNVATAARPVANLLPQVEARRGGFVFSMPPSIADAAPGVGIWTHQNDVDAGTPEAPNPVKPSVTIECAPDEITVRLHAVTAHLVVGNLIARWQPELVASWLQRLEVAHARLSEQTRLATIIGGSVAVTTPTVLGAARDVFEALDRLAAQTRSRERMDDDARMDVILPGWAKAFLRSDLVRQSPGDDAVARADAMIDAALRERQLRATFALDLDPFTAAQAVGAITAWPATMRAIVFAPGTWVAADDGRLDLGTVRTREDVEVNRSRVFYEDFEATAKVGPVPSFVVTATVAPTGATQAPVDLLAT